MDCCQNREIQITSKYQILCQLVLLINRMRPRPRPARVPQSPTVRISATNLLSLLQKKPQSCRFALRVRPTRRSLSGPLIPSHRQLRLVFPKVPTSLRSATSLLTALVWVTTSNSCAAITSCRTCNKLLPALVLPMLLKLKQSRCVKSSVTSRLPLLPTTK